MFSQDVPQEAVEAGGLLLLQLPADDLLGLGPTDTDGGVTDLQLLFLLIYLLYLFFFVASFIFTLFSTVYLCFCFLSALTVHHVNNNQQFLLCFSSVHSNLILDQRHI